MADEFNSMQAQLGLVGQGGSFNPLGIATPAPPPPPMVRHPGEISQDIVRQTQTAMATTLQTTSAMRLGGMGGMAFGGGGGGGGGIGAIGAFSQQYQQNMMGIGQQQVAPFSAQMMGMMGGMGGGFQPGMMPHPAMMTTPGMGIYRPFPQQQGPTVSPFPQMPMFQTPFTPMPPPPQFQTPMELSNNMAIQAGQRRTAAMFAVPGVAARAGADIGFGAMGAGLGASIGARFGPAGAILGGGIGGLAGMMGSEHFGFGATAQHMANNLNPFRTMAIRGQQMMGASQSFVHGGPDLNMQTGRGLSGTGATHLGRMLEDTAYSTQFKRQTGGAFSAQDLTKITQISGQQGLLNDAQSVDQIHDRVKGIAKSLVSFMKIANEPNVVEALKSMGRMRSMGMSIGETMDMAVEARMYSKMAGTSVKGIMESGGLQGAMMFQQQGLSAGLGMRVGVGAQGMANAAVAGGAFSPQRLAMLGGVQGVAQHDMESSAAFLKMPMMSAAMSRMGPGGEFNVDGGAIRALRGGQMNIGQMATMGANNLLAAVQKQGVGALGMAQVQGTEIQDAVGRLLGPQGLQAAKMGQVMQTMKMMGLDKNPGGFATAGLAMGMSNDQVKSMMSEAGSPGYWRNLQQQNRVQQMELRGLATEERDRSRPGLFGRMTRGGTGDFGREMTDLYGGMRNLGEGVSNFFASDEQERQARDRGQVVLRTDERLLNTTDDALRRSRAIGRKDYEAGKEALMRGGEIYGKTRKRSRDTGIFGAQNEWDEFLGGDVDDLRQLRQAQGGMAGALGGGAFERGSRALLQSGVDVLSGFGSLWGGKDVGKFVGDEVFGSASEHRAQTEDLRRGSEMWAGGSNLGAEGKTQKLAALAKSSGVSKEKLRQIVTESSLALGGRARADLKVLGKEGLMGDDIAKKILRENASRILGVKPSEVSDSMLTEIGSIARDESEVLSGGNKKAFLGRDLVDAKGHKEYIDKLTLAQDALTSEMFGEENVGADMLKGTRTRRSQLVKKIFEGTSSPKVAMLAALREAAEGPNSSPEGKQAYLLAMKGASEEEIAESVTKSEALNQDPAARSDVAAYGRRLAGQKPELREGIVEAERIKGLVIGRDVSERVGKRIAFGTNVDSSKSTGELLAGNISGMKGKMRDYAERYQFALSQGKTSEAEDIKEEASQYVEQRGFSAVASTEGGERNLTDEAIEKQGEVLAETEGAVKGAFPESVKTFDSASRALLKAAQLLNKRGDHTDLPNDAGGWR
jgi:hypothetical protein